MRPTRWNGPRRPRNGWPVPQSELLAPGYGPLVPRISGVFRGADPPFRGADLPFHGMEGPNRFFDKGRTGHSSWAEERPGPPKSTGAGWPAWPLARLFVLTL